MKVIGKNINDGETSVDIDLFEGQKLPKRVKKLVNEAVGEYLVEQTLISIEKQQSPVAGQGSFKPLSKEYAKIKQREVGNRRPNLEAEGTMKDELDFVASDTLNIGVYGERAGAADGHNNLSGRSKLTKRQFLPDEGETYKRSVLTEIARIKADIIAEEMTFKPSQFNDISSTSELYAKLRDVLGLNTRSEINLAVIRNQELTQFLSEQGLYDLLKF